MISKDAVPFRIDHWDPNKYTLKTRSGLSVDEIKIFDSRVEQPVICAIEDNNGVTELYQYGLNGSYSIEGRTSSWDLFMDPIAPYISDDFQIGPEGAYEHIEEVKMPIRESREPIDDEALLMRLYKETGKSVAKVMEAMIESGCDYEKALKLLGYK
jgi:hypothetical protein